MYSRSINELIKQIKKLPSVGQRTAERFIFYWLKSGKKDVNDLRLALNNLLKNTKSCSICWNFDDFSPCAICTNKQRDHAIICVVSDPQDMQAIENTNEYSGVYHILRGTIQAGDENESLSWLKIKELIARLNKNATTEVILALNPDMPGETTALYLEKIIKNSAPKMKISRLARGLPMGSDLQYADEITLGSALKNRK